MREGYVFFDTFYLNNSGFYLPWVTPLSGFWPWAILTLVGIGGAIAAFNFLSRREIETGKPSYPVVIGFLIVIAATIIGLIIFTPLEIVVPERQEGPFGRLQGGAKRWSGSLLRTPHRTRHLHISIHRRDRPRWNPGRKPWTDQKPPGLSDSTPTPDSATSSFRKLMRVIIPPLISQYLNLTKNSSHSQQPSDTPTSSAFPPP